MRKAFTLLITGIILTTSCEKNDKEITKKEGWVNILENEDVYTISESNNGNIWFGGYNMGVAILEGTDWKYLDYNDGLNDNTVRSLYKSNDDVIWIGTTEGLNYYENEQLETETELSGEQVSAIHQDIHQNLWFGTYNGLYKYDGSTWEYYNEEDGLIDDFIESVTSDDNGKVWVSTGEGLSKYDGTKWENYDSLYNYHGNGLDSEYIPDVMVDSKNNVWAVTWGGGLLKHDGDSWITFTKEDGLANNYGRQVIEDDAGKIIVGTTGGVSIYDGENWENESLGSQIRSLFKDSDGILWAGTKEDGAFKFIE